MALAVRLALLVSIPLVSRSQVAHDHEQQREVYQKDSSNSFWTSVDKTLADIRQKAASGNGLSASE